MNQAERIEQVKAAESAINAAELELIQLAIIQKNGGKTPLETQLVRGRAHQSGSRSGHMVYRLPGDPQMKAA